MVFRTEMFIETVKQSPVLWNSSSGDNKNRTMKDNAWDEVANKNSCSTDDSRKYWKNLRNKFVRERKLVEDSKRCGGSAESVYV